MEDRREWGEAGRARLAPVQGAEALRLRRRIPRAPAGKDREHCRTRTLPQTKSGGPSTGVKKPAAAGLDQNDRLVFH
jgi:hypothetical protein